ncbi:Glutathione synthetase [Candidatus Jidaibacter acanthamoeba]|uniref:Glutathione synthetase n=2 Tax=Candidatus Jidaibacter acanthamoebae TaxID=86105 RepID=A0A0C1QKV3_9RICK|nr:Glutathione synthetase [Candidatus Jidaibacter acanthamoeba]
MNNLNLVQFNMTNNIVAIQMDPLNKISFATDSSWLIAYELFKRGFALFIYTPRNLFYRDDEVCARGNFIEIDVYFPAKYNISKTTVINLAKTKAVIIRQNPPFNMEYITTTYLLELIKDKTFIINNPTEIRNYAEKLCVLNFPSLTPATLIASSNAPEVMHFIETHKQVVIKPIYAFGGLDIEKIKSTTYNIKGILNKYVRKYGNFILQQYLPSIREGDKRIILLDGEILGAIKRVPEEQDFRANLVVGGSAQTTELSERDHEICLALKPELKKRGLFFVGIDIIDKYLIEINVTSPTGLVAINRLYNKNVEVEIANQIESKLNCML